MISRYVDWLRYMYIWIRNPTRRSQYSIEYRSTSHQLIPISCQDSLSIHQTAQRQVWIMRTPSTHLPASAETEVLRSDDPNRWPHASYYSACLFKVPRSHHYEAYFPSYDERFTSSFLLYYGFPETY